MEHMNLQKSLTLLALSCMIALSAHANTISTSNAQVPFYNLVIQPAEDLYVDYKLDADYSAMRCKIVSGDMMANIQWEYMGVQYRAQLPLTLKASGEMEAQLTDQRGTLIISSTAGYSDGDTVTCEYVRTGTG